MQVVSEYRRLFPDVVVGYSGHELGFVPTLAAAAAGAAVVERHFTMDKAQRGSDHRCSLDYGEMCQMESWRFHHHFLFLFLFFFF